MEELSGLEKALDVAVAIVKIVFTIFGFALMIVLACMMAGGNGGGQPPYYPPQSGSGNWMTGDEIARAQDQRQREIEAANRQRLLHYGR